MKEECATISQILKIDFISHMVQMKDKFILYFFQEAIALYIPHGSDERKKFHYMKKFETDFISHMVQMKVSSCSIPSFRASTLYPTWFRWKRQKKGGYKKTTLVLYIPHGSDESHFCVQEFLLILALYIPHGSDERRKRWIPMWCVCCFISHMVQMKARNAMRDYARKNLYIPHGSDESPSLLPVVSKTADFISHMVQMKDTLPVSVK